MPTPSETFISWKAEIAVEMTAAREQMEAAEAVLAQARASLARPAGADQRALAADELAADGAADDRLPPHWADHRANRGRRAGPVAAQQQRSRTSGRPRPLSSRRSCISEEPKVLIAELKIALEQIEWLGKPANAEAGGMTVARPLPGRLVDFFPPEGDALVGITPATVERVEPDGTVALSIARNGEVIEVRSAVMSGPEWRARSVQDRGWNAGATGFWEWPR